MQKFLRKFFRNYAEKHNQHFLFLHEFPKVVNISVIEEFY